MSIFSQNTAQNSILFSLKHGMVEFSREEWNEARNESRMKELKSLASNVLSGTKHGTNVERTKKMNVPPLKRVEFSKNTSQTIAGVMKNENKTFAKIPQEYNENYNHKQISQTSILEENKAPQHDQDFRHKQLAQNPIYELIGDYASEEHLLQDLLKFPQCVPCPQRGWAWQTKDLCKGRCGEVPSCCLYWHTAPYKPIEISEYDLC